MSPPTTPKKASEAALSDLHAELAKTLKKAMGVVDEETGLPNSAILSVARQFLKDNFITADTASKGSPLAELAGMPEFDADDNVIAIRK